MTDSNDSSSPGKSGLALAAIAVPARLVLAAVFGYAAFLKLRPAPIKTDGTTGRSGPLVFADSIGAFKLGLPEQVVHTAIFVTPWIEIICAICLLIGLWTRAAALIVAAMLIGFIGLFISVIARGINTPCGCFGDLAPFCPKIIGMCHIYQDAVLLVIALLVLISRRHILALDAANAASA